MDSVLAKGPLNRTFLGRILTLTCLQKIAAYGDFLKLISELFFLFIIFHMFYALIFV